MEQQAVQERRTRPRFALRLPVSIRIRGGLRRQAQMINLTEAGACLSVLYKAQPEEPVWLDVGDYRNLASEVIWSTASFVGVKFASALHPGIFANLLQTEPSSYDVDSGELKTIANRAVYEAARSPHDSANQLDLLAAECSQAAAINALVQRFHRLNTHSP